MQMRTPLDAGGSNGTDTTLASNPTTQTRHRRETSTNPNNMTEATKQINLDNDNNINNNTPSNTNTNSFYNSWGDNLPKTKQPHTMRVALRILGVGHNETTTKKQIIRQYLDEKNIDIFLTTKNNVVWHWIPPMQCLHEQTQGWSEAIHLSVGHNKNDSNANPYQPGGVVILSRNKVVH